MKTMIPQTVEALTERIGELVAERQDLRGRDASPFELESNRRHLAAAQAQLSLELIARHLPQAA